MKTCSMSHTSAICCATHIVHLGCLTNLSSTGEHLACTPDSHDGMIGEHVARDNRMHLMHILVNGGMAIRRCNSAADAIAIFEI